MTWLNALTKQGMRKYHLINKPVHVALGLVSLFVAPFAWSETAIAVSQSINQQREQAVLLARRGQLSQAIQRLQHLNQQSPQDQKIRADLIILLRQAGLNQQILNLTKNQKVELLPSYAVMAWLGALRDEHHYERAQQIVNELKAFYFKHPSTDFDQTDLSVYDMLISVESGNVQKAQMDLAALNKQKAQLNPQQQAQLSYAQRVLADLIDPRVQAVALAKQGHTAAAIQQLQQLHQESPNDVKVIADLIVLLRQIGNNQQIVELTARQDATKLPPYAVLPWVAALRDAKAYARAEQVINALKIGSQEQTNTGFGANDLDVYQVLIRAEAGQIEEAKALLLAIKDKSLNAQQHAQLAYAYRLCGQPAEALNQTQKALALDASNRLAVQQKVAALSDMSAANSALVLAKQHLSLFSQAEIDRLTTDIAIVRLKDAIAEQSRLRNMGRYTEANKALDLSIDEINQLRQQFPPENPQYTRLSNDYIYALRTRERMPAVLQQFEQLTPQQRDQMPAYTRRAVADAYLALRQPNKALSIYQQLSNAAKNSDTGLLNSIYFALIESENYHQASDIVHTLDKSVPNFRYSEQKGAEPLMNWERLNTDVLIAMDQAYRNRNDRAEQQLAELYAKSPKSVGVMNSYATVLRWRGLPQKSDELVSLASVYDNTENALKISVANNAKDLGQYPRWDKTIHQLINDVPEDTGVQRNFAEWQDRSRPSIQSQLSFGNSDADDQSTNRVNGSSDREWRTRLNSPWFAYNWRLFAEHRDRLADFQYKQIDDQRLGVGIEWDSERKNAWLMLSQRINGDAGQTGVSLGWSQWLNDHWQYRLGYASKASDTPLQALEAGTTAQSYSAGLTWQQNESRSASLSYQALDMEDGNLRQAIGLGLDQRLQASEHHITTGGFDAYYEKNSKLGGNYFNPENNQSISLNLQHDWVTWREYDQSFTQHFEVSTGFAQQAGYSGEMTIDALYQHRWQLNRTWQLNYGAGWGSRVYDGNREQRMYGVLGLTGIF